MLLYIIVLYSYINFTTLDFLHSIEMVFFRLFLCVHLCFSFLADLYLYFYLMLMLTGCLAPVATVVIPGSQYSNLYS